MPFPSRKSFFEIVSNQLSRTEEGSIAAWMAAANLSREELDVLRAMRGPLTLFRRGEMLALMPTTFVR